MEEGSGWQVGQVYGRARKIYRLAWQGEAQTKNFTFIHSIIHAYMHELPKL
jgi:predicted transcriptional regulator